MCMFICLCVSPAMDLHLTQWCSSGIFCLRKGSSSPEIHSRILGWKKDGWMDGCFDNMI